MKPHRKRFDKLIQLFFRSYNIKSVNKVSLRENTIASFKGYQFFLFFVYLLFILIVGVFFIIGYGPLSSLLPQTTLSKKTEIIDLMIRVDSLENDLLLKSQYVNVITNVLKGELIDTLLPITNDSSIVLESIKLDRSRADSLLRELVEKEDLYNVPLSQKISAEILQDFVFFKPVEGLVTEDFSVSKKHYGVDIVTHSGSSVKACLDGVVVFADWSMSSGNMLLIQHADNIISVYMHNSILTKKSNDLVRAGEVIGIVGDSGESSSGPHLHFELWQNGVPINPSEYIDF